MCLINGLYIFGCDVSKEDYWQDLWSHTETAFGGKVSLLVNNAGVSPLLGWKTCINVMLLGMFYGTYIALEKILITAIYGTSFCVSPGSSSNCKPYHNGHME